jgi:hypothetical protein
MLRVCVTMYARRPAGSFLSCVSFVVFVCCRRVGFIFRLQDIVCPPYLHIVLLVVVVAADETTWTCLGRDDTVVVVTVVGRRL